MRYSKIYLRWSHGSTFGPKRWALLGLQRSKKFKNWLSPIFEVNFANLWTFGNFGSLASIFLWNWPDFCAKSDPVDEIFSNFKSKLKLPQIWCPISFWTFWTSVDQVTARDMVCTGRLLLLYWGFEAIFFWKNWSFKGSLWILPHETLPIWLEAVSTEERWESPNKLFPIMNVKVLTTKPLTLGRSWHLFTLPPFKFTRFCWVINN